MSEDKPISNQKWVMNAFRIVLVAYILLMVVIFRYHWHSMMHDADSFITALATVILSIFSLIQIYFFENQDKYLRESIEQTRIANTHSEKSASAALDGVNSAQKSAEKQLRAYLSIEPLANTKIVRLSKPNVSMTDSQEMAWSPSFLVSNKGTTPAKNVVVRTKAYYGSLDYQIILDEIKQQFLDDDRKELGVIFGDTPKSVTLSNQSRYFSSAGKTTFGFVILVSYEDVFGELRNSILMIRIDDIPNGSLIENIVNEVSYFT